MSLYYGDSPSNAYLAATSLGINTYSGSRSVGAWSVVLGSTLTTRRPYVSLAASTNTSANMFQVDTLSGSTATPLIATAGGLANGLKVDSSGNINAIGTAKFVGPVQLPSSLYGQSSLATDASGNIIPGTAVGVL